MFSRLRARATQTKYVDDDSMLLMLHIGTEIKDRVCWCVRNVFCVFKVKAGCCCWLVGWLVWLLLMMMVGYGKDWYCIVSNRSQLS